MNLSNKQKTSHVLVDRRGFFRGGECRIRTRVGLHPNGFQDRPVMTTSVTPHSAPDGAASKKVPQNARTVNRKALMYEVFRQKRVA